MEESGSLIWKVTLTEPIRLYDCSASRPDSELEISHPTIPRVEEVRDGAPRELAELECLRKCEDLDPLPALPHWRGGGKETWSSRQLKRPYFVLGDPGNVTKCSSERTSVLHLQAAY